MSKNHLQNDKVTRELQFMQDDLDPVRKLFPDAQQSYERVGLAGPVPNAVEPLGHPRQQRPAVVPGPLEEIDVTINGKVVAKWIEPKPGRNEDPDSCRFQQHRVWCAVAVGKRAVDAYQKLDKQSNRWEVVALAAKSL